jgi:putative membrane protein
MQKIGQLFVLAGAICLGHAANAADESAKPNPVKQQIMEWMLTDQKFVDKAVSSGRAEVELSQLAIQKSPTPRVKEFAQKMVDDHSKASLDLKTIAQDKGLKIPLEMDDDHMKALKKLQSLDGANFDAQYIDLMIEDHEKNVSLFTAASDDKKLNAQLQTFAQRTLPILKEHLAHVRALGKVDR